MTLYITSRKELLIKIELKYKRTQYFKFRCYFRTCLKLKINLRAVNRAKKSRYILHIIHYTQCAVYIFYIFFNANTFRIFGPVGKNVRVDHTKITRYMLWHCHIYRGRRIVDTKLSCVETQENTNFKFWCYFRIHQKLKINLHVVNRTKRSRYTLHNAHNIPLCGNITFFTYFFNTDTFRIFGPVARNVKICHIKIMRYIIHIKRIVIISKYIKPSLIYRVTQQFFKYYIILGFAEN